MSRVRSIEQLEKSRIYFLSKNKELYVGKTYQYLTVLDIIGYNARSKIVALVKCNLCGNERTVLISPLKDGLINSCGCNRNILISYAVKKHGLSKHPLHHIWTGMKQRCYGKKIDKTKPYYGKGITICELWMKSFLKFYTWCMENGWKQGLEIDRYPNKLGNYCPENCRIATSKQNQNNRTNNRMVIINGIEMTTKEASDKYKIRYQTLLLRLNRGLSIYEAISPYNMKFKTKVLM